MNTSTKHLELDFPHVCEKIIALWGFTPEFNSYMSQLAIDDRGGRQGFPPEIVSELLTLQTIHDEVYPDQSEQCVWTNGGNR